MTAPTQTINKGDKITYQGEIYRIWSIVVRGPSGGLAFYKYADMTKIG